MEVEAVREGERGAGLQIVGEVVIIDFRLMLVGGGDHDDVGPGGGVLVGHDLEARAFGLLCGRRTGTERDRDLAHAAVAQVLRVGVALAAIADDGDRSEEHTSELPSLMRISYAVFCLQKKKNQYYKYI